MNMDEVAAVIDSLRAKRRYWNSRLDAAVESDDPEMTRVAAENLSSINEQLIRLTNPNRVRVVTREKP